MSKKLKILVTGGAGFIGSHIVDTYLEAGHRVWVLDNETSGTRKHVSSQAQFIKGDVTQGDFINKLFSKHHFDMVNHHAAQIDVRASVQDPLFDARTNIYGLLNVLQGCIATKVKKIIFSASGGTAYGECHKPASESFPEIPLSPYGVAKLAGEKYIQAYQALHRLPYTIFRYANVYGPRQDPHGEAGVVAIFSQRMLKQQNISIYGSGKQTRDFVYVKDVAQANLLALYQGNNQTLNIGTGKETSVNQLFYLMAKISSYDKRPQPKSARVGELRRSVLNNKKAQKVLKWHPRVSLKDGLAQTLFYFRQHSKS